MNDKIKEKFFVEINTLLEKNMENKAAFVSIFYGDEHSLILYPKDVASIRMDEEFITVTWSEKSMRKGTETRVRFATITRIDMSPVVSRY